MSSPEIDSTFSVSCLKDRLELFDFLKVMGKNDEVLYVTVQTRPPKRSNKQLKYYFRMVSQISAEAWIEGTQYSKDAWHEYFARKFIGQIPIPGGNSIAKSTDSLSKPEFADYTTKVEVFAATDLGITFLERFYA